MHSIQIKNTQLLCQQYLAIIYQEIQTALQLTLGNDYGEVLFEGVTKLLHKININEEDVFVDLGSGKGKVVTQVFLQTQVKQALGVELALSLHQFATQAAHRIEQDLPHFFAVNRKLNFVHGNFLNYPLADATIVFVNAVCFSQELINSVGTILNELQKIHTIITLRPMATLTQFAFKRSIRIECSWDSALCYLYQRK